MGYDFEAQEDGQLTIEIYNHNNIDNPGEHEEHTYTVRKGEKYSVDYSGVKIRER